MLDYLPAEIVASILCKLPVKEVIRATSLGKSYYSLVHSKPFVSLYNRETLVNGPNPPLIFIRYVSPRGSVRCSLHRDNRVLDEFARLWSPLGSRFKEVAFCSSLVCLLDCRQKQLVLWNVCIRKTLALPKTIHDVDLDCFFGLGFVQETLDYKVLVVDRGRRAQVYSLQLNCWSAVAGSPQCAGVVHPACVGGSLYWVAAKDEPFKSVVMVFDLRRHVFGEISLPDRWESKANLYVRAFRESGIAVVGNGEDLGLRLPPERSREVCRTQVMDVNEKRWMFRPGFCSPMSGRIGVMGFRRGGEEIIDRGCYLTIAVLEDRCLRNKIKQGKAGAGFLFNYVCNLALLAKPGRE